MKRAPPGQDDVPVERYLIALEHVKQMPQYSTATNSFYPSQTQLAPAEQEALALGAWTPLGPGNIGGRTRALLIHPTNPSVMYAAGVAGGVWKTTNAGASWVPLADLLPNIAVSSLAMSPADSNVIYAGTGEGMFNGDAVRGAGIFKTTDAGSTWAQLGGTATPDFYYVNDIVVSANNPQRLYAATSTAVSRSTDGGASWAKVFTPIAGCKDLAIRTDQATDYLFSTCGFPPNCTVHRNTDAAGSGVWTTDIAELDTDRISLAIAPSNQNIVYALAASHGGSNSSGLHAVYRSTNGGGTWEARVRGNDPTKLNTVLLSNPVYAFYNECFGGTSVYYNQGWYDNVIAVDPLDSNRVWAGGVDLFRSDDGGANWCLASYWWADPSDSHFVHADQHVIAFHPQYNGTTNQTMFVGNDGGVFRTNNALGPTASGPLAACNPANAVPSWTTLNNGYGVTQFYHGLPYPSGSTYFGGTQDNGTIRGTDASGINNWARLLGGDGGYVSLDPTNTSVLYGEFTGLSLQKSTDGGMTWQSSTSGITDTWGFNFIAPFVMDPSNAQRLWIGGRFIWRTVNGGATWSQASAAVASGFAASSVVVSLLDPNKVLAGTPGGQIHRTAVGLSADGNTQWPFVIPRGGYVSWLAFDPVNPNVAYATYSSFNFQTDAGHVFKSTDSGQTWTGIDGSGITGIPDVPVHTIVIDRAVTSRLYVGTDIGVFVSLDGGSTWARENTGFANVITESLAINTVGGVSTLYAFTHGRGAWRVAIPSAATGTDTIGLYNAAASSFFLRNSNSSAPADLVFGYGPAGAGWIPTSGDWNGDGIDTIGLYNPAASFFFLRNANSTAPADLVFSYGPAGAGWIPISGDWNGDGVNTIGLYNPAASTFFLRNSNTSGPADLVFSYGPAGAGWIPVAGDWNGDGVDTIGLYNPATSTFFLRNANSSAPADLVFAYGPAGAGWIPIVGDWNGDGTDTIGLYNPAGSTFFLRNTNSSAPADLTFAYGPAGAGWKPIVGDWDGL